MAPRQPTNVDRPHLKHSDTLLLSLYVGPPLVTALKSLTMIAEPPFELSESIGGSFAAIGREFFFHLVTLAGLTRRDRVLDVGCGCGRIALPLASYVTGAYAGFDVDQACIDWCQSNITPNYPHFRFHWVDVKNSRYNPGGSIAAGEFTFPYPRRSFDLAIAASLFSHLLARDADRYIEQVSHVLRPAGRFLLTCFLLNDDSKQRIRDGLSSFPFRYEVDFGLVAEENNPEGAICLSESFIAESMDRHGIAIEQIHYGGWCQRHPALTGQDMSVARKLSAPALLARKLRRALGLRPHKRKLKI
jgi:SAM-dependent methyltransferase